MNMEANIPAAAAAATTAATVTAAEAEEDQTILSAIDSIYDIHDEILQTDDMQQRKLLYNRRNEVIRDLPLFWLHAFMSQPPLGALVKEDDMEIFKYLDSLNVEDLEDPENGYRITFRFKPNPYFVNEELVKTIRYSNQGTLKSTGTTINWKAGFSAASKRLSPERTFFSLFITPPKNEWEYDHDLVAEIIKNKLWLDPLADICIYAFAT